MKEWWNQLALREKQMLSLGAVILGLLCFYLFLWSPLSNTVSTLRKQVKEDQALLAWMQDADKQIQLMEKTGQSKKNTHTSGSILSIVQKQVNHSPLASNVTQLHQADNDSVQLTFQKVDFDRLMAWIIPLSQQEGFTITQMSITPSPTPGIVTTDVVLKNNATSSAPTH